MTTAKKTYRAGFKFKAGVVRYVGKRKMSGEQAYAAIRRVRNLIQYKAGFGFVAQNFNFNTRKEEVTA